MKYPSTQNTLGTPLSGSSVIRTRAVIPAGVLSLIIVNTAVFLILPLVFRDRFPYRLESLGTTWGPLVFSGEWWRLLTCFFVHFNSLHLFFNMLGLLIFGTLIERQFGKWIFILFYLTCGLTVSLTVLALHPEVASYGASGAVVGLAGAISAIYSPKFRSLSWATRIGLVAIILYSVGLVWRELSRGDQYFPHSTGLLAGAILAGLLVSVAKTTRSRRWMFIGLAPLLVIAGVFVQRHHRRMVRSEISERRNLWRVAHPSNSKTTLGGLPFANLPYAKGGTLFSL